MTIEEIRKNAPEGATHYAKHEAATFYFFESSYGFRQIKGNLIQFDDANLEQYIPL